ncbi:hypothetical protein P261_01579 [Lachnospiraceae bacterium TWA4]|nr:hypothetical protein P261_01579 [Lachnospiraceae bacterium TWA4]
MKKKLMALTLAMVMAGTMVGCSSNGSSSAGNETKPADQSGDAKTYKVGIVNYLDDASLNQIVENIEAELDKKSKELGVSFDYADYYQNAQKDSTVLNQITSDLVEDQVDLIVAVTTPVAMAVQTATENNQIPVVFSAVTDPVGAKLVESMEKPGSNITGTSDALDTKTILSLAKAANPDLKKIGLLYDTSEDSSTQAIAQAKEFCDQNKIEYVEKTGSTTDDVILAADSLVGEKVDAVFTPTDNTIMAAELSIYEKFKEAKIPHYTGADSFALNGAFLGYGVDYANLGIATADMAVDILTNGKNPADTPVVTFDNGIATVNTEICDAIGFDLQTIKKAFSEHCTQFKEIQTGEKFE